MKADLKAAILQRQARNPNATHDVARWPDPAITYHQAQGHERRPSGSSGKESTVKYPASLASSPSARSIQSMSGPRGEHPSYTSQPLPTVKKSKASGKAPAKSRSAPFSPPKAKPQKVTILSLLRPLDRRDWLLQAFPATLLSIIRGSSQPLMTRILGYVFNAYTEYSRASLSPNGATQADKDLLSSRVRTGAVELVGLGFGTVIVGTAMMTLWIYIGEKVTSRWRARVFFAINEKPMEWFDKGMGAAEDSRAKEKGGAASMGAAGLMARFTRCAYISLQNYNPRRQKKLTSERFAETPMTFGWQLRNSTA